MSTPPGGPVAIQWLREFSGLTQQELAARSGLSERTIRGLQQGQVVRPHRSSLTALARAGGLGAAQTDAFLRAWSPRRSRSLAELGPEGRDLILAETMVQSEIEECLVSSFLRFRVDRDGHFVSADNRCTIQARRDGVNSYCVPLLSADPGMIPSGQLTRAVGCHLMRRHAFPAAGLAVIELGLERTLALGELATFDFLVEAGPGTPDLFGVHPADPHHGELDRMLYRVVDLVVLDIEFERAPDRVWETAGDGTGPGQDVREVTVHDNRVQIVKRNVGPGVVGFRWTWF